jgi:hypothetical protein
VKNPIVLSEPLAVAGLFVVALVCAAVLFILPRAVAPLELPSLSLPRAEVEAVMRADALAARSAPESRQAKELWTLYLEQGRMERAGIEDSGPYAARRKALVQAFTALVAEAGEQAAMALRAKAVEQLDAALALRLPAADAQAALGALSAMLAKDGVSRDGYLVAPSFVMRTFHKGRWNLLHGLPPDHRFAPVERRTFYGWEALHAERVPLHQRIAALHEYGLAGGKQVEEALGILAFRMGDARQAVGALEAAYRKQPSLRLRNYLAGARAAAAGQIAHD